MHADLSRDRRKRPAQAGALVFLCVMWAAGSSLAASSWEPAGNVELVVAAGPGGGNDRVARTIQSIIQGRRLVAAPVTVVNKPGGGGAVGWSYLRQHAGKAEYLSLSQPNLVTNNILGRSPIRHTDFTLIAQLYDEYVTFAVASSNPVIQSGRELLAALKKDPGSVPIALAPGLGSGTHIAAGLVLKRAGVDIDKVKFVAFPSAGQAMTALLGGHVGLVPTTPGNVLASVKAGNVRVIGVSAPRRLPGELGSAPTWKEQGVDAVFSNWRGIIAAPGLGPEQVAYWGSVFGKLAQTEEWAQAVERTGGVPNFLGSAGSKKYLEEQYVELKEILAALGLIK